MKMENAFVIVSILNSLISCETIIATNPFLHIFFPVHSPVIFKLKNVLMQNSLKIKTND